MKINMRYIFFVVLTLFGVVGSFKSEGLTLTAGFVIMTLGMGIMCYKVYKEDAPKK